MHKKTDSKIIMNGGKKSQPVQRISLEIDFTPADLIALGNSDGKSIATRQEAARFARNVVMLTLKQLRNGAHLVKDKGDGK